MEGNIILKLGDIIQIQSPTNLDIHEQTYFIDYINDIRIRLINIATLTQLQLNINENGNLTDESIQSIDLLHRSDKEGYARQNSLLPSIWLDIYIGGEFPVIITGEITNLEEDMIEVTTFPELQVIYIDFEYKGVPENIPFEKFVIRKRPNAIKASVSLSDITNVEDINLNIGEDGEILEEQPVSINKKTGEINILPETTIPDKNYRDVLNSIYLEANDIIYGEELDEIIQAVELPEREHRYGIDLQVNDLMDELLSTIPNSKRTKNVLDNIHTLIERFKQMRTKYSKFDENGNINGYISLGVDYKPLVERIKKLDTKLQWILPVVSQKRKFYYVNENDLPEITEQSDIIPTSLGDELIAEDELMKMYNQKTAANGLNKYNKYYSDSEKYSNPIRSQIDVEGSLIEDQSVLSNLDAVVNNLEDFYSTVSAGNDKFIGGRRRDVITQTQFVIQRYNMGLMKKDVKLMRSGKSIYIRNNMTPNDTMTVKSVLMLPEPIVKFSQITLPGTNISKKTALHQNFLQLFRLLKPKNPISKYIVDDLKTELDYEKIEETDKIEFLSTVKEYILDEEFENEPNKFEKFLKVIIPRTRTIIRLIRKYIKDKISFVQIVKELEPFMVYSDFISYGQYQEIRFFIIQKIKEFRTKFLERSQIFKIIREMKYPNNQLEMNRMKRLLDGEDTKTILYMFQDAYNMKDTNFDKVTSSEILSKILNIDSNVLFSNLLSVMTIKNLSTPEDLMSTFQPANIDDLTNLEKIKPQDCIRRYLTKKYTSVKDLQSDNNKVDVYYDKDFDDTIYSIIDKYKKEQKQMDASTFLEFLIENLIVKHDAPSNYAPELAATLITGKKKVNDGEYAILELRPKLPEEVDESKLSEQEKREIEMEAKIREKKQYYKRVKDQWIHDDTIDTESFIDTNTLFCNIRQDCTKNQSNNVCDTKDNMQLRMTELTKARMVKEFDNRVNVSIEQLEEKIKNILGENFKRIIKDLSLREIKQMKFDKLAYNIGKNLNKEDILVSPNARLRELIFEQDDFSKKQTDIVRFVDMLCREPMIDALKEDVHWLYCKETNTKLLPLALYELALAFNQSTDDYIIRLDQICRTNGILSDDGDSIVDKYSGYVLRKIDFVTEDEYTDEGFRIISHSIMQDDLETTLTKMFENKRVFENELNETIFNITNTVCMGMGIDTNNIIDFVTRNTLEIMDKNIQDPKIYEAHSNAFEKKNGRRPIQYEIYKNRFMFWIISANIVIAIQTAIPSFKLQKTYPRCVRSISGYPMDGIEDLSGIQYIACILHGSKSEISPWNSISKLQQTEYVNKIKETLDKFIMKQTDIIELYTNKREYKQLHSDELVPDEHSIDKWRQLLPPIVEIRLGKPITNISSDFEKELLDTIRKGHKDQRMNLAVLKSKCIHFGYGIIEKINKIVKSKDLLLKTNSSRIPFMENACCNENNISRPMDYFIKDDITIAQYIQSVSKIAEIYYEANQLSKASLIYHPDFTGNVFPMIEDNYIEENIYSAYIYYCNLDNELPIPISLRSIFPEKLAGYKSNWTLVDKIEFLKRNRINYKPEDLHQLMRIIKENNLVVIKENPVVLQVNVIIDLLDGLDTKSSTVIEEPLRNHLRKVMESYNPQKMVIETRTELKNLKDYLVKSNENMYYEIINFLDKNGNLNNPDYNKIQDFFINIAKTDLNNKDNLYRTTNFIRNSIYFMSKVFPTMILNGTTFENLPKHWNFSEIHYDELHKGLLEFWQKIKSFHKNTILSKLLSDLQYRLTDIFILIRELPIYSSINKNEHTFYSLFDDETIQFMHTYLWYSTIYEYINAANNPELLRTEILERRRNTRIMNSENSDLSLRNQGLDDITDDDTFEQDTNMQEMEINAGNKEELKSNVALLILAFVNIEQDNKKFVLSYKEISKKIRRSRKQEKDKITKYLGEMDEDERKIEDQFKNFKMGRWNVGMQKGLVRYDKETFDREQTELAMDYQPEQYDIADLETDQQMNNTEGDNEGIEIEQLGENYGDGQYYAEDRDENDL